MLRLVLHFGGKPVYQAGSEIIDDSDPQRCLIIRGRNTGMMRLTVLVLTLGVPQLFFGNCVLRASEQNKAKPDSELVRAENVQGCYELALSAWRPNLNLGEDAVFITPPARIQIFAERGTQGWESAGYIVKPAPGVKPSIHRGSYWLPKNSDSIEITWTTGLSGLVMSLKIEGTDLRGKAVSFWDFSRKRQTAQVVAHRVGCQEITNTAVPVRADCQGDETQPKVVAGEGWGPVRIGADLKAVEAFLGKGKSERKYSQVFYRDYAPKGLQVAFENASNTVHNIYFYHGQGDSPDFAVFCGLVDKGITWQSSPEDVKRAYGQPTADFTGTYLGVSSERLVFDGIDFRFENEKMVRIGIPGN